MNVELEAIEEHHRKSWKSNSQYYRKKYKGLNRLRKFVDWLKFKFLDFLWGNGEKLSRLVRFVAIFVILLSVIDLFTTHEKFGFSEILSSLKNGWLMFTSFAKEGYMSDFWASVIHISRLAIFALFVSILIKRLNRR